MLLEKDSPSDGWGFVKRMEISGKGKIFDEGYCPINYLKL
jgi:hypothetical protein